jgi:hypothetical protein
MINIMNNSHTGRMIDHNVYKGRFISNSIMRRGCGVIFFEIVVANYV